MSQISQQTVSARESARATDGRFGPQVADEAACDLSEYEPVRFEPIQVSHAHVGDRFLRDGEFHEIASLDGDHKSTGIETTGGQLFSYGNDDVLVIGSDDQTVQEPWSKVPATQLSSGATFSQDGDRYHRVAWTTTSADGAVEVITTTGDRVQMAAGADVSIAPVAEFTCQSCGRDESLCTADPCPGVISQRQEMSP